ncbi:MAG: LysR family transcriptional regulator [Eubacterium sp.]|nr:LysR family transcriptional regulator [Eubacterium sp.]
MEQTLSSYSIFYTVADCQNISKAAAKLYISQPAVSKSIQKLETSLGCRLFIRTSRGVQLTEEGMVLYQHVKSAMDLLRQGETKIRQAVELGMGHLRIGVSSTLCKYVLLPYLKDFVKENPYLNISITCQSTSETLSLIQEDQLEVGLVGTGGSPQGSHAFCFDFVSEIQDVFVAGGQYLHHLKERGIQDHEILQNSSLMLLDKNNITRQYIDEYLQKNEVCVRECIDASAMDLLIEFAKINLGVAGVIRQFIEPELEDGTLVEIPLPAPIPKRSVGFVYKPQQKASQAMEKFIRFFHKSSGDRHPNMPFP